MPSQTDAQVTTMPRILLVDDEPALLRLMGEYLRHLGYSVEVSKTGAEAFRALEQPGEPFSLIVADLTLPDVPGEELLKSIRASYPGVPILVCSGLPYSVEHLSGQVRFLQKPFLPKMLAREIEELIGPPQ